MLRFFPLLELLLSLVNALPASGPSTSEQPLDNKNAHIVQGVDAVRGDFPELVSLQFRDGGSFCGGTLLNRNTVLTAAHCLRGTNTVEAPDFQVVAGEYQVSVPEQSEVRVNVDSLLIHPEWDEVTLHNDVALVFLASRIRRVSGVIGYVNLAAADDQDPYDGQMLDIAGWGDLVQGSGDGSDILKRSSIPYIEGARCKGYDEDFDPETQICAGFENGGTDTCQGDSGGPLFTQDTRTQVGIVSYSNNGCAAPNDPTVYTKISAFRNWIDANSLAR